jgi:hypothetical protein
VNPDYISRKWNLQQLGLSQGGQNIKAQNILGNIYSVRFAKPVMNTYPNNLRFQNKRTPRLIFASGDGLQKSFKNAESFDGEDMKINIGAGFRQQTRSNTFNSGSRNYYGVN